MSGNCGFSIVNCMLLDIEYDDTTESINTIITKCIDSAKWRQKNEKITETMKVKNMIVIVTVMKAFQIHAYAQ